MATVSLRVNTKKDIEGANAAREEKWAAVMANKENQTEAQRKSAEASLMHGYAALKSAKTGDLAQQETSRHNIATEGLENTKLTYGKENDVALQGIQQEKNKIDRSMMESNTALQKSQALNYEGAAAENKAKAGLLESQTRLRDDYLSPTATDKMKSNIQGLYQAEAGNKPADTKHVIPGQKVSVLKPGGGIEDKVTNPLIVNEETGTSTEVKPETPTFATPEEKLKSLEGTADFEAAAAEYEKKFGKKYTPSK